MAMKKTSPDSIQLAAYDWARFDYIRETIAVASGNGLSERRARELERASAPAER